MSAGRIAVALGILSTLSLLMHRYVWARLVRDAAIGSPWQLILGFALFFLALLVPLSFVAMRALPRALNAPIAWIAYTWLGFLLYLFLLALVGDLGRGIARAVGTFPPDDERRQMLSRGLALGVALLSGAIGVFGLVNVARGFIVRRVRVPLLRWPQARPPYFIVQLTDVHVGPTIGREFVEEMVRRTNALSPDLVVITGDLVDGSVEQLGALVAPLRDLRARDGVYFVTGNHEYYSGADEWLAFLESLGVRVLRNERVSIRDLFDLAGVDDASAHRILPHHGQDVAKALSGRDPARVAILLAHQPKAIAEAQKAGVDLQISGHVHGGQLMPFNWLARLDQPFVSGLHRAGETWIYVSMGTGYWGPPMRVGSRAELTLIELAPAATPS